LIRFVRPWLGLLIPLDENVWFHRQFAYSILFWTVVHTTSHCESRRTLLLNFSLAIVANFELSRLFRRQHDQRRTNSSTQGGCLGDHVYSTWRLHWSRYASHHATNVHHRSSQDSKTMLRSFLVYSSPRELSSLSVVATL